MISGPAPSRQVYDSPEWKDVMAQNGLMPLDKSGRRLPGFRQKAGRGHRGAEPGDRHPAVMARCEQHASEPGGGGSPGSNDGQQGEGIMSDRIFGGACVLLAAFYIYFATQIQIGFMSDPMGPRAFPILIGIVLGAGRPLSDLPSRCRTGLAGLPPHSRNRLRRRGDDRLHLCPSRIRLHGLDDHCRRPAELAARRTAAQGRDCRPRHRRRHLRHFPARSCKLSLAVGPWGF